MHDERLFQTLMTASALTSVTFASGHSRHSSWAQHTPATPPPSTTSFGDVDGIPCLSWRIGETIVSYESQCKLIDETQKACRTAARTLTIFDNETILRVLVQPAF